MILDLAGARSMRSCATVVLWTAAILLLSSCNQNEAPSGDGVHNNAALGLIERPEPPPPPPPPPNYAPAIEAALRADDRTASYGYRQVRVDAMRAIDLSQTPSDFREAYLEHIFAWERRVRAERAWNELTANENTGPIILGGIICAAINCEENPVNSRIEAERRLTEEIRLAAEQVSATFRDVQRVAVRHGANPTVSASPAVGSDNVTSM